MNVLTLDVPWQITEYSYLLELADECEDPHKRLVYVGKVFFFLIFLFFIFVLAQIFY